MDQKIECPKCGSPNIHIDGHYSDIKIEENDQISKLMLMRLEEQPQEKQHFCCDDCKTDLKLTKQGLQQL